MIPIRLTVVPWYPVVVALAFILSALFASGAASPAAGRAILVAVLSSAALVIVAGLVARNVHAGAVAIAGIEVVLIASPAWLILLAVLERGDLGLVLLLFVPVIGAAFLVARIARRRMSGLTWSAATARLNGASALLLAVVLGSGLITGGLPQAAADVVPRRAAPVAVDDPGPDVILVLMDGYPRADTLDRLFGFDNSAFLERLEDLDLDVAERSRSNYAFTQSTLASMLHMCHLESIPEFRRIANEGAPANRTMRGLIENNPVFDVFRSAGYEIHALAPGIESVTLRSADVLHDSGTLNEFEYHLLKATALDRAIWAVDPSVILDQHRRRLLNGFDTIERIGSEPLGGRLVVAHFIAPHMPAVFYPDGSLRVTSYSTDIFVDRRAVTQMSREEWVARYLDHLAYVNVRLVELLEQVVDANPEAVVVVMSDHGSGLEWDPDRAAPDHDERHPNLFAARTPGRDDVFSEDQTPVNVFPRLLNSYFGRDVPIQPDTTFAGEFNLVEVSNPDGGDAGAIPNSCLAE